MTKMTKRETYEYIMQACAEDEVIVNFCQHEIELLDNRKGNSKGKPTAKQKANEGIKDAILAALMAEEQMSATQIAEAIGESVPKVSALLRQLRSDSGDGRVERIQEGKKIFYKLA